jgi:hypothetical protein
MDENANDESGKDEKDVVLMLTRNTLPLMIFD